MRGEITDDGFRFESEWISGPLTKRSKAKLKHSQITSETQLKRTLIAASGIM